MLIKKNITTWGQNEVVGFYSNFFIPYLCKLRRKLIKSDDSISQQKKSLFNILTD